ncbi:hypothetical protein GGI24_001498, partial [Coemansia furcata]
MHHLNDQHPLKYGDYDKLTALDKATFFDKAPSSVAAVETSIDSNGNHIINIHPSIVDVVITQLYLEDNASNAMKAR